MRVKVTRLGSTEGMAVKPKYLQARRLGARGKIMNYIAGHGGDCWWIRHDDGTIGGYGYMEFQRVRSKRRTGERTK
ncbi:MAG: hypothetical protein WC348_01725 [Patescibacteria group bacterium]|jgi:hypothetical protein